MSNLIAWIGAEAERAEIAASAGFPRRTRHGEDQERARDLRAHEVLRERVPAEETEPTQEMVEALSFQQRQREEEDRERERRIYRGRTVAMLRRYMRYSIETGRLPSLLGREFFRAKVTEYTVVTFEDRVIFVHDMEKCLEKLDEFSRQLIARHILQEHDQAATGKLLHCTERTVRTYVPVVLDLLVEILLDVGLMERLGSDRKKILVKGVKKTKFLQVIVMMGNIKFKFFPVYPLRFAMLEIESKKKEKVLVKGASQDAPFAFIAKLKNSRETGWGHDQEEG